MVIIFHHSNGPRFFMYKYFFIFLLSFILSMPSYSGGGMTHMYIAQQAIKEISDPHLRYLLLTNLDAYLVGAYYPDSGYIKGLKYGEISHWDPFVNAFSQYLQKEYTDPVIQNPKLVAFLFGIASHRVSDEVIHWIFYKELAAKDFRNNQEEANNYGDVSIDLLLAVDKNQWENYPKNWWVPINHLEKIYRNMGVSVAGYEIIYGTSVLKYAGYLEKMIAEPAYPFLKLRTPWLSHHYLNWPIGGIQADSIQVAQYQNKLWQQLNNKKLLLPAKINTVREANHLHHSLTNVIDDFAADVMKANLIIIPAALNKDGSVELKEPDIKSYIQLSIKTQALINSMIAKLK